MIRVLFAGPNDNTGPSSITQFSAGRSMGLLGRSCIGRLHRTCLMPSVFGEMEKPVMLSLTMSNTTIAVEPTSTSCMTWFEAVETYLMFPGNLNALLYIQILKFGTSLQCVRLRTMQTRESRGRRFQLNSRTFTRLYVGCERSNSVWLDRLEWFLFTILSD